MVLDETFGGLPRCGGPGYEICIDTHSFDTKSNF